MWDFWTINPPATAAVIGAVACQVLWPFCKRRSVIIMLQLGMNAGFTAHYGLLGFWAASAVSALAATQALAAIFAGRCGVMRRLGYGLIPAMICCGAIFWNGPVTLLAVIAMILVASGRMQTADLPLRLLLMAGSTVWAVHDAIIQSYIAFAADLTSLAFGLWSVRPYLLSDNRRELI